MIRFQIHELQLVNARSNCSSSLEFLRTQLASTKLDAVQRKDLCTDYLNIMRQNTWIFKTESAPYRSAVAYLGASYTYQNSGLYISKELLLKIVKLIDLLEKQVK